MNGKTFRKYSLWLIALIAALCLALTGCSDEDSDESESDSKKSSESSGPVEYKSLGRAARMALTDDGELQIERSGFTNTKAMGDEGTWTIFVYMCGSDLESQNGMATGDLEEMLAGSTADGLRYVVAAGGSGGWYNDYVDPNGNIQYLLLEDGDISQVGQGSSANMASPDSLKEFLSWGVSKYPAEKMGLIFWNHGGGSITGVCFDELNEYASLSLNNIDTVLDSVSAKMTDQFEFIGFDACLMGTVEDANMLASYARYMYGSEETEPGYGWDYEAMGDHIDGGDADGASLGEVVADSFYDMCEEIGSEDQATFSIIDLSKIDDLMVAFNDYAMNLYDSTEDDTALLSETVRNVLAGDNYGGNNKSEGYTNMVDLGSIIAAGTDSIDGAEDAWDALQDCIVYSKNGKAHADASGLSTYYPLEIQGSQELSTFGNIAISPYYLAYVSRAAYATANGGNLSGYDSESLFSQWDSYQTDGAPDTFNSEFDYYQEVEPTGESPYITFASEPALDEDGNFGFTLTQEALDNTASVEANVFAVSEDGNEFLSLGVTADLYMDWDTGEFADNFDGTWFSLPDSQPLCVNIQSQEDGYDVYSAPVELNGEATNLMLIHDYENDEAYIYGVWDGIDENGMAARDVTEIKDGDTIAPLYDAMKLDSDEEYTYVGDPYKVEGELVPEWVILGDGDYMFGFSIDDIYGDFYDTDYEQFTVEGEDVWYSDEE